MLVCTSHTATAQVHSNAAAVQQQCISSTLAVHQGSTAAVIDAVNWLVLCTLHLMHQSGCVPVVPEVSVTASTGIIRLPSTPGLVQAARIIDCWESLLHQFDFVVKT
jgi:hypothetical protein